MMTVHSRLVLAILLAIAYWIPQSAFAQVSMTTAVQVSKASGAHSPAMHVGRDGAVYVSWFQSSADIYFSRSTDQGQTFATPVRVCKEITTNQYTSLLQRAPEFAIDTKGVIHLVWTEGRINNQGDVWYVRSTDSGKSWSQAMSIMDPNDSQKYAQDFSAIACDSSDNLYVSYLDNRYLMRRVSQHYRMNVERSTNGGQTWSLPVIADKLPADTSGTCECCRQDIAASADGHVYVAFRTNMTTPTGDKRDIFICRSWDGGRTFDSSIRCQLGGWTLDACPTKGPHIALDPQENLFVAWNDARDDSAKLMAYFDMLPKGATTVFPNYSISNSEAQAGHWPYVAVSPTGLIAYAFMPGETLGGPIQFTYSSDGGNTWNRARALPGTAGDNQSLPELVFDARGHLYAAWQDGVGNGIMCSTITGLSQPQLPDTVTSHVASLYAENKPLLLSWSRPQGMRTAPFVWYTFRGGSGPYDLGFSTRDTFFQFDSLTAGEWGYLISARTTIGYSSIGGFFTVGSLASVAPEIRKQSIAAYPNPSAGIVTLTISDLGNLLSLITITNALGVTVKTLRVTPEAGNVVLDVRDVAAGVYNCKIESANGTWWARFVIAP